MTTQDDVLDVRVWVPTQRHETLHKMFAELPKDGTFTFKNDHDPKPLYYEFLSIYGDVVGWEYLQTEPKEWTVRVTRLDDTAGRDISGIDTLIDLRKTQPTDWNYVVFHRYGNLRVGETMELITAHDPEKFRDQFARRLAGKHAWTPVKETEGEYVIHIKKLGEGREAAPDGEVEITSDFDVRPHEPADRHEMVYDAFYSLEKGQAFRFTNDHDPKPLYFQLEAESNFTFTWVYLEEGPEVWRVQVTRTG